MDVFPRLAISPVHPQALQPPALLCLSWPVRVELSRGGAKVRAFGVGKIEIINEFTNHRCRSRDGRVEVAARVDPVSDSGCKVETTTQINVTQQAGGERAGVVSK